jgi:hypothetical protein
MGGDLSPLERIGRAQHQMGALPSLIEETGQKAQFPVPESGIPADGRLQGGGYGISGHEAAEVLMKMEVTFVEGQRPGRMRGLQKGGRAPEAAGPHVSDGHPKNPKGVCSWWK